MDDDKILELTGKIEETLGKEDYAMISDTIGEILTGNAENMKAIAERDENIRKLENRNEKLVTANGAVAEEQPQKQTKEDPPKKINLKDALESKSNFIH